VPAAEISHSGGEDRTSFDRPFPGCPGLSQFQVTLQTVRSPTGMLGLNLARSRTVVVALCSPRRLLTNTDQYSGHNPLVLC